MRRLVALVLVAGCGETPAEKVVAPTGSGRCFPVDALELCPYSWECEWGRVWSAHGDAGVLSDYIVGDTSTSEAFLRTLFPAINGKPIVDIEVPIPSGVTYEHPGFDVYDVPMTIDWSADPFANNTWRHYFQALHFPYFRTPGDPEDLGAALLVSWRDHALYELSPPDYTWGNVAVAIRLTNVSALLDRYIANRTVLSRTVLQAAAEIILTHLYMLATDSCYAPGHNHGMWQDIALLEHARKYPAVHVGQAMWDLAQSRAMIQAQAGVSSDGFHIENTSTYHFFFLTLLDDLIRAHQHAAADVPAQLVLLRDSMFEPLVQQIQPDLSFPLFGDTNELDLGPYLQGLITDTTALGVGDPTARNTLEWVTTGGASGVVPATDAVFENSGYAVFRDHWGADAATVHFKTGHLGIGHYRPDETGFEFFAHGIALVTEPGLYNYVEDDPLYAYELSPAAQNVLVVDDDTTVFEEANPASRVLAHGQAAVGPWVQGTHDNFAHLGVDRLVRTVVFAKPDVVIVVDHVRAGAEHDYAQHFHLHPSLDQLVRVDERTVIVKSESGPSLTIAAGFLPEAIATDRGVADGAVRKGWYFPVFLQREPAYDVVFQQWGRDVDLAEVFAAAAPGQPATTIKDVTVASDPASFTVSWLQNGNPRQVSFPAPR